MSAESVRRDESDMSQFSLREKYLLLRGKENPSPINIKTELKKGHRILVLARQGNIGKELEKIIILDLSSSVEGNAEMESMIIDAQRVVTRENCDDVVRRSWLVKKLPRITLDPVQIGYRRVYTQQAWFHSMGHAEQCRWGELFWTPVDNKVSRGECVHIDLEIKGLDWLLASEMFGSSLTDGYVWSVVPYSESELPTAIRTPQPALLKMAA